MATAGSIVIDLLMRTGAFETDTGRAEKRLKELQKTAKVAGAAIGTAFVAAGTALTVLTKQAIDNADAMRDMSIRLGTSVETLSAFGYAASQTGTDVDTLAKGMKVLAKNAADSLNPTSEQAKVFDVLGVKVTDASGKLKDLSQLVPEIADKFKQLEDGTTKAALAQALFGKAGLDLTEFLNQGATGLDDFTAKARELGIVIDQDTANAADEFNDQLGDMKALVGGLGLQVAKELLPELNSLVGSLVDVVKEGSVAKDIADGLGTAFSVAGKFAAVTAATFRGVAYDLTALALAGVAAGKALKFDYGGAAGYLKAAADFRKMAAAESDKIGKVLSPSAAPDSRFKVRGGSSSTEDFDSGLNRRLGLALSNPTASGGGSRAKQLSEEEKEAKRLLETYGRLTENFDERIALFGKEGEAVKVRYDIEFGELAKLAPAQQADLLAKAERLDQMNEELELQRKLDEADQRRLDNFTDVMQGIKDQTALVGMSSDDQEIWNNLKYAGVTADSEWGRQIIESTRALQQQADAMENQIELMDGARDAGREFFDSMREGEGILKSLENAFGKFADALYDWATDSLIEQFFGKQGQPAGGSSGGWINSLLGAFGGGGSGGDTAFGTSAYSSGSGGGFWGSLFGAFFGGGRAGGGDTIANRAYLVGEEGPELFVPRTAGSVLSADHTASAMSSRRSDASITQNFYNPVMSNMQTQTQRAAEDARKAQRSLARNS